MFNKFKELFASETLLDSAVSTTLTMMASDHKMYKASSDSLRKSDTTELPFDIKKEDRRINKYLREVRRNVLTHLTIAGTQNIVPGLVLVSIVIDVERIGDYTKNISELATMHPHRLNGGPFEDDFQKMENTITDLFPRVIHVLTDQDVKDARAILSIEDETGKIADHVVSSMIEDEGKGLPVDDSVCLALYARHLKRINAHLTNIASSIVNPFPRIGFRAKKIKDKK
jgi:phosphate transport system protein